LISVFSMAQRPIGGDSLEEIVKPFHIRRSPKGEPLKHNRKSDNNPISI
jgi:hypothetical protein